MDATPQISPVQRVLVAAAGRHAERAAWVFALDAECARIARMAREPIMAQIRLAWWRDALSALIALPEHRTAMTDAMRALPDFVEMRTSLVALIDGWEELVVEDGTDRARMLLDYARGRGEGLFGALAPDHRQGIEFAGSVWALWDLAGHSSDAALADAAVEVARGLAGKRNDCPRLPRMLAMMAKIARDDVARGRGAPSDLTFGLYARLLRVQFFGQ